VKSLYGAIGLAMLFGASGIWGQETTAGFQGAVKDPTGGLIANATVEISSPALIGTRKAQTDAVGNYRDRKSTRLNSSHRL